MLSIHYLTLTYKVSEAAFQEVVLTLCQRLRTFRCAYPLPFRKDGLGEEMSIFLLWLLAHGPVERQARLEMGQRLIRQAKDVGTGVVRCREKRCRHHPEQGAGQIAHHEIVA